jgi:hypothetical protein
MTTAWSTQRIYAYFEDGGWKYFHSPDGVGKIFHTNEHEAKEQTGIQSVVHLIGSPFDEGE